jgi:hypothetical protein
VTDVEILKAIHKVQQNVEEVRSLVLAMRNRVDALDKFCQNNEKGVRELQGKVSAISGRVGIG